MGFSAPAAGTLQIKLAESWEVQHSLPSATQLEAELKKHPEVRKISFDSSAMTGWDSALLTFLLRVTAVASKNKLKVDQPHDFELLSNLSGNRNKLFLHIFI